MPEVPGPPGGEPQLPAGETNKVFFEYQDAEAVEHLRRPGTVEGYVLTARQAMVALTVLEHQAFPAEDRSVDDERRFFTSAAKHEAAEDERQKIEHRAGEPRTVQMPIPSTVAYYTEGVRPDTGEFGSIIKIQPEVQIPDLDDENLTEDEQMRLFSEYRRALQFPTEFSWSSDNPGSVIIQRGEESMHLRELPVEDLVRATKFLRKIALWRAMDCGNQAVLDRLQFVDDDIPSRPRLPKL
jgi:hypothetical protein